MEQNWWLLFETNFDELNPELQRYLYDNFYSFAYKEIIILLKDHALAEDVIQEAFLKITAKHKQLVHSPSIKQWTRRILRNQMIDILRKEKRHETSLDYVYKENGATGREASEAVESTVEDSVRNQVLHDTILALKPSYSTLLIKFYIEEKSYKEMSAELGLSEQVITQRLARARKKLLSQFTRKWVDEDE